MASETPEWLFPEKEPFVNLLTLYRIKMLCKNLQTQDYKKGNAEIALLMRVLFGVHERNPTYPYQSHLHQRSSTYEKFPASLI